MSPTGRALLALEVIQNNPGVTAARLGARLGVTDRAARRYVAILREADLPIESGSGPHGGYRVGRGLRLPPLMFSAAEAMGLVMAVLEGHKDAADPADLVGSALAKILRVLPQQVAGPVSEVRDVFAHRPATIEETSRWLPRSLGRLKPGEWGRTHLLGTTDEPDWYARQIAAIPAPFRVIGSAELQHATAELSQRLAHAAGGR